VRDRCDCRILYNLHVTASDETLSLDSLLSDALICEANHEMIPAKPRKREREITLNEKVRLSACLVVMQIEFIIVGHGGNFLSPQIGS